MVDDYTTVGKSNIDELIKEALEGESIFVATPIEHYNTQELIELAEKAKENDLVITLKAEHSNFYQGSMVNLIKRENINSTYIKYM